MTRQDLARLLLLERFGTLPQRGVSAPAPLRGGPPWTKHEQERHAVGEATRVDELQEADDGR